MLLKGKIMCIYVDRGESWLLIDDDICFIVIVVWLDIIFYVLDNVLIDFINVYLL